MLISIEGNTLQDVQSQLVAIAKGFGLELHSPQQELPLSLASTTAESEPKKAAKKSLKKETTPVSNGVDTTESAPSTTPAPTSASNSTSTPSPTFEQAFASLKNLSEQSMPAARAALAKVGAGKMKDVTPDKYSELVAACADETKKLATATNASNEL